MTMTRGIVDTLEGYYGVTVRDLAEDVIEGQREYHIYEMWEAEAAVLKVLEKTEVQNAMHVGFNIDKMAYYGILLEPLLTLVKTDDSNFGIDEEIALGMAGLYGSIAKTNFGYIDKMKIGVAGRLNALGKLYIETDGAKGIVTTMADDLVGAVVACAEGYLAKKGE